MIWLVGKNLNNMEDIAVGSKVSATRKFDFKTTKLFAELTGDYNPVHFDEEYARGTIFKKPIVHGPLVLTLITTLFANKLPGPGSVYLSHEIKFLNPVYYEDEILAELEVVEINSKGHIFIKTICKNQNDIIVISGTARLKKM